MDKHPTSTACHVGREELYELFSAARRHISSSAAVTAVRAPCLPTILDRSMASLSCSGRRLLRSSSPPLLVPVELCPWVVALPPKLLSCPRRSVQPLALGSDASCCYCWGLGQGLGKMRSADDRATSQQGAAFGVPLSAAHPGASPRRPCVARVESICAAPPPWLTSRSVPKCLARGSI